MFGSVAAAATDVIDTSEEAADVSSDAQQEEISETFHGSFQNGNQTTN